MICTPSKNDLLLIHHIIENYTTDHYHVFCEKFYDYVNKDINNNQKEMNFGINQGFKNTYMIYEEYYTNNADDCPDGLDKGGGEVCSWIRNNGKNIVITRRSDYPW